MTLNRAIPFLLLLMAACATSPSGNQGNGGNFVAEDAAPDADPVTAAQAPTPKTRLSPLTSEEQGEAALLVAELEQAGDDQRDEIVEELIELGPRYLEFLRRIESDAAAIDLLYVVRRIERTHDLEQQPEPPGVVDTGAAVHDPDVAEPGPELPPATEYGPEGDDFDRTAVERFLRARLQQARRMADSGQYSSAIRIAEAAIVLMPDTVLRPDFEAVIRDARGESQADLLIAGTMSLAPEHLQYDRQKQSSPFKQPLQIRCFLKNVSTEDITLRLYEGEGKESILQLTVSYDQLDFQGTVLAKSQSVRLPVDGGAGVTLTPNESYSMTVPLEGLSSVDSDASLKKALGRVQIDAALRVYGALNADGSPLVLRPVKFPQRSVLIFPAGFDLEGATAQPLNALQKAINQGDPQGVYLAAHLITRSDRRAAGDALFKDYDISTVPMQIARLAALSVIFDKGRAWEIKRWREWWNTNRLRQ